MRIVADHVGTIWSSGQAFRVGSVAALSVLITGVASAQSILVGNFLPNPDMETETRFVPHRTEGPTDNSFADYWHHGMFSGWNDLTPPVGWPPAPFPQTVPRTEPVLSGLHSLRLFDQDTNPASQQGAYYFAPEQFGGGSFAREDQRTFATEIPLDLATPDPVDRVKKLWVRWHWNYHMTDNPDPVFQPVPEADQAVTFNIRISNGPVVSLDLVGSIIDKKTVRIGSSGGLWEQETVEIDLTMAPYSDLVGGAKSFDLIFETKGLVPDANAAVGLLWVDDVSVSAIDPTIPMIDADFDGDVDVDGNDLLIWQRGLGLSGAAATNAAGNADGDADVDGADVAAWRSEFGMPQSLVAATQAPEPASWALILLGLGYAVAGGRRRTRC